MKKLDITKRDVKFFFLGILAFFIIDIIFNWHDAINSFMDGWNSATQTEVKK